MFKSSFSQNGSVLCAHVWNRTEISIDCHIARAQDVKISPNSFLGQLCTQCKFSWKNGEAFRNSFQPEW